MAAGRPPMPFGGRLMMRTPAVSSGGQLLARLRRCVRSPASRRAVVGVVLCAFVVMAGVATAASVPKRARVTRAMIARRPWLSDALTPQQRAQLLLAQMTL